MDPTKRFSSRVDNYVRYRPGYPPAVLALLQEECGLMKESAVADVGSGTGFLSQLFLGNGNRVFGVEPNPEMRQAGESFLAEYNRFTSVVGTAESTTLPDSGVDFVVAGQAFHWFDPATARAEFSRILKPGGWVVLVWNARKSMATGFSADYEKLLEVHGPDYEQVNHGRRGSLKEIRGFFAPEEFETATLENYQVFDFKGIKGRMLSSSYVPNEGEEGYLKILESLKRIFSEHESDGKVILNYDTKLYYGLLARS